MKVALITLLFNNPHTVFSPCPRPSTLGKPTMDRPHTPHPLMTHRLHPHINSCYFIQEGEQIGRILSPLPGFMLRLPHSKFVNATFMLHIIYKHLLFKSKQTIASFIKLLKGPKSYEIKWFYFPFYIHEASTPIQFVEYHLLRGIVADC